MHRLLRAGIIGHMAFDNPDQFIGGLSRVDYEKYAAGEEEYLILEGTVKSTLVLKMFEQMTKTAQL